MEKIIARMRGGVGNQLFIAAFAYKLATESNEKVEIVFDNREYNTYRIRQFELYELFDDERIRMYDEQLDRSLKYEVTRRAYHVLQKIIPNQAPMSHMMTKWGYYYSKRSARGYYMTNQKVAYLYGYFQDAEMVSRVRSYLLNRLKLPDINQYNSKKKKIAVSIRWGKDYVSQGWPICSERYFIEGVREIIKDKYDGEKVEVLIFSDEISIAKQMVFPTDMNCDISFIEGFSAIEQLALMSKCDDYVLSNSSFSWWGAFCGATDDSIVIIPNRWYASKELTDTTYVQYKNTRIREMN